MVSHSTNRDSSCSVSATPDGTQGDLSRAKRALEDRLEPSSKKELYKAELQSRKKWTGENWTTYGEGLTRIAEKAYPDLPMETHQCLALNQYLTQIINHQVLFSIKQKCPNIIDVAVQLTLELSKV